MPGVHDPDLVGWLTVAAYLATAWLAARAARAAAEGCKADQWTATAFWAATTLIMLLLAINKQADLQTALTDVLRRQARAQGWYEQRRAYQLLFIEAMLALGGAGGGALLWWVRRQRRAVVAGAFGLLLTAGFVVVRAASFHHHDVLGRATLLGLHAHILAEWLCILSVAAPALAAARSPRSGQI